VFSCGCLSEVPIAFAYLLLYKQYFYHCYTSVFCYSLFYFPFFIVASLLGQIDTAQPRHHLYHRHYHSSNIRDHNHCSYSYNSRDGTRYCNNAANIRHHSKNPSSDNARTSSKEVPQEKFPCDLNEYRDRYFAFRNRIVKEGAELWEGEENIASDSRRFTERRKKTVRFDRPVPVDHCRRHQQPHPQDWSHTLGRWASDRQSSQDSQTKDSGIDTSSTFTSSEDSNRGEGPKVLTNLQQHTFVV
jgi:hypothetical protein